MAIGHRATATATAAAGVLSLAVPVPSGTVDGDVMVTFFMASGGSNAIGTLSPPAGWQQIGPDQYDGDPGVVVLAYWRRASSEPESYSWGISSVTTAANAVCLAYSGVVVVGDPIEAQASRAEGSSSVSAHATPTVTVATSGAWLLTAAGALFGGIGGAPTWTTSDALDSERADLGGTGPRRSMGVYDSNRGLAPGSVSRTLTSSVATATAAMWAVVLKPEPSGQTSVVGQAVETDAALAVAARHRAGAGRAASAETVLAATAAHAAAAGLPLSAEDGIPAAAVHAATVGAVGEGDTAAGAAAAHAAAAGPAVEAGAALAASGSLAVSVGAAVEVDSAFGVAKRAGPVKETDTALPARSGVGLSFSFDGGPVFAFASGRTVMAFAAAAAGFPFAAGGVTLDEP